MESDSNPVVLVTGGSRGIGAATCKLFAKQGYKVAINYLNNAAKAEDVKQQINEMGGIAETFQADVANEQQVLAMFNAIDQTFGTIDVLVNNAGKLEQQMQVATMSAARISDTLITNVLSCFLCAQQALLRMSSSRGGKGGAIVNVSSGAASTGSPNEYVDYAASKGAIDTFTRGLATEVASENIRVNCVRPGLIYTEMHADGGDVARVDNLKHKLPMQRGGKAEEVAEAILWLATDKSSFVTGSFIDVSGGL